MPDQKATTSFILGLLGISEEELHAQGIVPQTLVAIYNDFIQRKQELTDIAEQTVTTLQRIRDVHVVRYRVKDPIHLLRKIIRKRAEYPDRAIVEHNYMDWINDLVGVRVLHLYKESWHKTGQFIQEVWELKRPPIAYISASEATDLTLKEFKDAGCTIRQHDHGYRAVHYVINTKPYKQRYFLEIQLRTLFEEGWSEIDHNIRYPDHASDEFIDHLLQLLNKLTSCADEMATHIRALATKLKYKADEEEVRAHIDQLPVSGEEKQLLHAQVSKLTGRK